MRHGTERRPKCEAQRPTRPSRSSRRCYHDGPSLFNSVTTPTRRSIHTYLLLVPERPAPAADLSTFWEEAPPSPYTACLPMCAYVFLRPHLLWAWGTRMNIQSVVSIRTVSVIRALRRHFYDDTASGSVNREGIASLRLR